MAHMALKKLYPNFDEEVKNANGRLVVVIESIR